MSDASGPSPVASPTDAQQTSTIPPFISPPTIREMSDEQFDLLLNRIRTDRMRAFIIHSQSMEEKERIQEEKLRGKIDKKCEQIAKLLERHEKLIDDMEIRVNELRALRMQAGLSFE